MKLESLNLYELNTIKTGKDFKEKFLILHAKVNFTKNNIKKYFKYNKEDLKEYGIYIKMFLDEFLDIIWMQKDEILCDLMLIVLEYGRFLIYIKENEKVTCSRPVFLIEKYLIENYKKRIIHMVKILELIENYIGSGNATEILQKKKKPIIVFKAGSKKVDANYEDWFEKHSIKI